MNDMQEGQAYVNHLSAEHRRLDRLLAQSAEALDRARESPQSGFARFRTLLQNVRDELQRHFRQEEAGGCLEEAMLRCPQLGARVAAIEAAHPRLLAAVDEILSEAQSESSERAQHFAEKIAMLRESLQAHEQAENTVVSCGLASVVNGED